MADLGTLGGPDSAGYAINSSGQVAGYSYTTGNDARHAFRYTGTLGSGGAMADLGTLGGNSSAGYAINGAGQVTGSSQKSSGWDHAFRYSGTPGSGGSMVDLGTLGGTKSYGYAINEAGQVAGASQITGSSALHAFLYTGIPGSAETMVDLGTLGGTYSEAYAINDAGNIVGYSWLAGSTAAHAFLYAGTPGVNGVMTDLDTWLDATNPVEGANWTLYVGNGLTGTGLITGFGEYNDGPGGLSDGGRAFLLDASSLVPEPASLVMLALGSLVINRPRTRLS